MKKGEIVFCNLQIEYKKKKHILLKVVYKFNDGFYYRKHVLDRLKIHEKVIVLSVDVISNLGYETTSNEYTEVKKSNEIRNKITGAYE